MLMQLWSLLQFWCHCSRDTLVSGVVPSILVLLFVQCSNNFGHCFDFGLGVIFSAMLLFVSILSLLELLFIQCSIVFIIVLILVLLLMQCSSCIGHCSDFGVALSVMLLLFFGLFDLALFFVVPGS